MMLKLVEVNWCPGNRRENLARVILAQIMVAVGSSSCRLPMEV